MKKYIYLLLSMAIFSCTTEDDALETQGALDAASKVTSKNVNEVSLVKAWASHGAWRWAQEYSNKFTVNVANLGYDKNVSVFHEKTDGNWEEIPLFYSFSIDDQNEIWTADIKNSTKVYDDEFVIKYEVNGQTYWDNNNGANYIMPENVGYFFADSNANVSVDDDFTSLTYTPYYNRNSMTVTVDVRNLSPSKEVGVVYSTDGWQTQSYFALSYRSPWTSGPLLYIKSPNQFGIERWSGFLQLDPSVTDVEYAVVYKVNGQEYWDNNYGENYKLTR